MRTQIEKCRAARLKAEKRAHQDEPREAGKLGANAQLTAILSGRIAEISI
jgi:hypothetical protein